MNISPVKLFTGLLVNLNVFLPVLKTFEPAYSYSCFSHAVVTILAACTLDFFGTGIVNTPETVPFESVVRAAPALLVAEICSSSPSDAARVANALLKPGITSLFTSTPSKKAYTLVFGFIPLA